MNMVGWAKGHLAAQGRTVTGLTHRVVCKGSRCAHLFRGKEKNKTVRFVAVESEEGFYLVSISTTERKWVGKTARTDILRYRQIKKSKPAPTKRKRHYKPRKKKEVFTPCVVIRKGTVEKVNE